MKLCAVNGVIALRHLKVTNDLEGGHRSKLIVSNDSLTMISYMMAIHIESLQAIIKEIQHDLYKFDLESHR